MHPLSDILTTRELQRWRLILGPAADNSLGGLDERARQVDRATGGFTAAIRNGCNGANGWAGWKSPT